MPVDTEVLSQAQETPKTMYVVRPVLAQSQNCSTANKFNHMIIFFLT